MAVYKLRVTFEDYEDIYRDIEVKSSQTFYDLHEIILQSIGFDSKHAASFFVSDEYWRKNEEFTLLEEDLEDGVKLMKKIKISSTVVQPNQRYIYLYDKQVLWSFLIQLIKLVPEDIKAQYPRCIKTVGQAPKQYKQQLLDKLKEKSEEESELDKSPLPEEEIYKAVADEKLVFDEDESQAGDLHDDENAVDGEHEGEEGEEHEGSIDGHEEESDH
ncbi:MAG TPA: hypothetical protein VNZ49_16820 [Bacteroidia bacterium]|jgi:hypothetical protein|nr:hypothetical protein [Bacteroidia bacterium]